MGLTPVALEQVFLPLEYCGTGARAQKQAFSLPLHFVLCIPFLHSECGTAGNPLGEVMNELWHDKLLLPC